METKHYTRRVETNRQLIANAKSLKHRKLNLWLAITLCTKRLNATVKTILNNEWQKKLCLQPISFAYDEPKYQLQLQLRRDS